MNPEVDASNLLQAAIMEDLGSEGDITSRILVSPGSTLRGFIVAKQKGTVCGIHIVQRVLKKISPRAVVTPLVRDGARVSPGRKVARVSGPWSILSGERIALNFLQHLSGIATATRAYADQLKGTRCKLLDTRKTLPGWRALAKYAVRCGGGVNHRMGLYDAVMIKDNHVAQVRRSAGTHWRTEMASRVRAFKRRHPRIPVIIEAKTHAEVEAALECRPDVILLDNMPLSVLRKEVRFVRAASPKTQIEVSGGVDLSTIRTIAKTGVDRVSVGRITHSAPAMDFSLEISPR